MNTPKLHFLIISLVILFTGELFAQKTYTDFKPSYRSWQTDYLLDKVEHTKTQTIFHIRFALKNQRYSSAIFYAPNKDHPWYLKDKSLNQTFELQEIRNIKQNGVLVKKSVKKSNAHIPANGGNDYSIFSCEIHFKRLPKNVKVVDLIEGKGQEYNRNHFNFFNVIIKESNSIQLGSQEECNASIAKFENKYNPTSTKGQSIDTAIEISQQVYTDFKPVYRQWIDSYILEKIEYTKDQTIFYIHLVFANNQKESVTLYPPDGQYAWFLRDRITKQTFNVSSIKNVTQNGKLITSSVDDIPYKIELTKENTILSCEVHFERLPITIKNVNLIEGQGQDYNKNHFNFFNISLKEKQNKSLGTQEDSDKAMAIIRRTYGINYVEKTTITD